jgi:predicted enzyme related to lactoylglutathione lyase
MANVLNWFEIPVVDMDRACKFYSEVFGVNLESFDMTFDEMTTTMAMFPYNPEAGEVGGSLVKTADHEPNMQGTLVYLNGGDDLNTPLGKVESAGGKVIMPKVPIGENGFMAMFIDTEGNRIGFHSMG